MIASAVSSCSTNSHETYVAPRDGGIANKIPGRAQRRVKVAIFFLLTLSHFRLLSVHIDGANFFW
jgi:hypothetical protein